MKIYDHTFLKCAFLGLFILDPTLISANKLGQDATIMDTLTLKIGPRGNMVKEKVNLTDVPQWLLESESKNNPDPKQREKALHILITKNEISRSSLSSSNSSKNETSQHSSDFSLQSSSSKLP
jgi:hypothetical protein